jgi:carboxypeptidase family protein
VTPVSIRNFWCALCMLALTLLTQLCAAGQEQQVIAGNNASISGTVTDATGAVVTGAKVALSDGAGLHSETQTNDKGTYDFRGLKAGTYNLSVTAPNFSLKTLDNVVLAAGQELTLEVPLEPARAKIEVNVESSGPAQVEVENATVSGTITEKEVVKIGLNGRNFTQLIALAPGVSNQTGQDEAKVGVVGSVKYSVNGGRVEYNSFEVDGSDVLNTGLNGAASTLMVYPSLDAIQEVKVLTSNYGAQFGRTASGTVQVITKSGTSKLHGNIYDFIRNEAFNSRNYFDLGTHAPLYRRQDFGGTIGGPLTIPHVFNTKRDKTFFFFSEELRLEKTPTEYNQAVPSLKERGLKMTPQGVQENLSAPSIGGGLVSQIFDFSDVCPLLGTAESFGFDRQKFPDCPSLPGDPKNLLPIYNLLGQQTGGQPSTLGVDKNALAILNSNLIPLPNSPIGCNFSVANIDPTDPNHCYNSAVSPSTYWREELFRIDQLLGSKVKASFRYVHDAWDTTVLTPQWGFVRDTFPTVQNRFVGPGTSLVGRLTNAFSPTLLNDLVLSYTNATITLTDQNGPGNARFQRDPTLDQPLVVDSAAPGQCDPSLSVDPVSGISQCGMGHLFNNGFGGKMPGVALLGTNAAYGGRGFVADPAYMPWGHTNPTYAIRDDIGKSVGNHTLQFGAQYVLSQRNQTNNAIGAASGDLQGLLTFSNLAHSTGNAFADFLVQSVVGGPGGVTTGFVQSFTQDSAQRRYYQRYQIAEPYFQDDWKVTRRFTLNLGLRISLFGTYQEKNHNAWNWEAARFNSSRFAVDSFSGVLLDKNASSMPVQLNPNTFQLDPGVVSDLGLVQCGVGGSPGGCMKGHLFNPAPRIGFAWDPRGDGKTSVRGGYGIFFEHGTGNEANTGSLEASAPLVLTMTQPLPLSYPCIGNVGYGSQFDPTNSACTLDSAHPAPPAGSAYPLNVTAIPTKAIWPYAQQWSFGIQRELPSDFVVMAAYVGSKGTHLTIERQLNQLPPLPAGENPFGPNEPLTLADCTSTPGGGGSHPGDGTTPFFLQNGTTVTPQNPAYVYLQAACTSPNIPNVNSLPRPYPGLGKIFSLENAANSSYHAFQFTLRRTRGPLTAGVSYSYSHSFDNSSDRSDPVLVDSYNLRGNRASSNFDQRHLLNFSYVYALPLHRFANNMGSFFHNEYISGRDDPTDRDHTDVTHQSAAMPDNGSRVGRLLLDGWEISGVTLFQSGTPFTVINSAGNTGISLTDNAGVSSGLGIAASYPDVVHGLSKPGNNSQSFGPLLGNPSQFVAPRGLTFGDAGRNFLNNPHRLNFDLSLLKHFKLGESSEIEFHADGFNIFNVTQFRIYDPDNPGSSGNNIISCYAGPVYSAGFTAKGGADCVSGASFLHPLNAHRPRTIQFGLKLSF